jgi:hypothetical protein
MKAPSGPWQEKKNSTVSAGYGTDHPKVWQRMVE